jgi:hypothetical protein
VGSAPGWPTDAEIAAALPVTSQIWAQAKLALHGSMFQLDEPVDVEVTVPDLKADPSGATMCRKTVTIDPVGQLATGTAPAYAKIAGGAFTNPYAMAGIVVGGVFGPKLAQLGFMAVRAWLDKPKAEPTKTQNAPVLTAAEVKK